MNKLIATISHFPTIHKSAVTFAICFTPSKKIKFCNLKNVNDICQEIIPDKNPPTIPGLHAFRN